MVISRRAGGRWGGVALVTATVTVLLAQPVAAATPSSPIGSTRILSVDADHVAAGGAAPSFSGDGRYTAYSSIDPQLGEHAANVLYDDVTGSTTTIGNPADFNNSPSVTEDGRFVFFAHSTDPSYRNALLQRYNVATGQITSIPLPTLTGGAEEWSLSGTLASANGNILVYFVRWFPDAQVGEWRDDIFVTNMATGTTAALGLGGENSQVFAAPLSLSDNGRLLVLATSRSLVPGDRNNGITDLYLRNVTSGAMTLVSKTPAGQAADSQTGSGQISGDGRHVAFTSTASNILPGADAGLTGQSFIYDTTTDQNTLLFAEPDGSAPESSRAIQGIRRTGRYLLLTAGPDTFGFQINPRRYADRQVFRYDRKNDVIALITHARRHTYASNMPTDDNSGAISGDGQHIAFGSFARDLVIDPALTEQYQSLDVFLWSR